MNATTSGERLASIETEVKNMQTMLTEIKGELTARRTPWWQWVGAIVAVMSIAIGPAGAVYAAVFALQMSDQRQAMQIQMMQHDLDRMATGKSAQQGSEQ